MLACAGKSNLSVDTLHGKVHPTASYGNQFGHICAAIRSAKPPHTAFVDCNAARTRRLVNACSSFAGGRAIADITAEDAGTSG